MSGALGAGLAARGPAHPLGCSPDQNCNHWAAGGSIRRQATGGGRPLTSYVTLNTRLLTERMYACMGCMVFVLGMDAWMHAGGYVRSPAAAVR